MVLLWIGFHGQMGSMLIGFNGVSVVAGQGVHDQDYKMKSFSWLGQWEPGCTWALSVRYHILSECACKRLEMENTD